MVSLRGDFLNLGKNEFSWKKKGSVKFLNIPIIYHHVKNQKKLEKCHTNRQSDRKTVHKFSVPHIYEHNHAL